MQREDANITSDAFSQSVEHRLRRLRIVAKICSVTGSLILGLLVLLGILVMVVPRVMGVYPYAIVSGSMEPAYPVGSIVYAKSVDGSQLQEGDVAAFWRNDDVIVHRVLSIDESSQELVTKGDANTEADMHPVPYRSVLGRVVFSVPMGGSFLISLGSTVGRLTLGWIVLMGAALCIVGTALRSMVTSKDDG